MDQEKEGPAKRLEDCAGGLRGLLRWTAPTGSLPYPPVPKNSRFDLSYLRRDFLMISYWPDDAPWHHLVGELATANTELEQKMGWTARQIPPGPGG